MTRRISRDGHDVRRTSITTRLARTVALAMVVLAGTALGLPKGGGGGSQPVAKISVIAPPMEFFIVEATLPVPPRTVLDGMDHVPLAIASGGHVFSTQVEIVSRYANPAQGADVVELIARVQRPVGVTPGQEFEFDIVSAHQPVTAHQTSQAVTDLIQAGGVNLSAHDLLGNEYSIDLLHRIRAGHPSVTMPRDGAHVQEHRSHEVMRPVPGSGQGAGPPDPHMLGAHVFARTYANEDFIILDLLLHNGMYGELATPLDDPIYDVYFDALELDVPAGWSIATAVESPGLGAEVSANGRVVRQLVQELRYGQFHYVPQQAQFMRRIVVARGSAALARGTSVLRRETRGFCVPGGERLWSWWNPSTARFQTTNAPLPTLEHMPRAGIIGSIQGEYDSHAEQLRSGEAGGYPRYSPLLGWAQPWGVQYGGMTGGDEIEMYPNISEAWARHPVALRNLELRSKAYVDRHPVALFDLNGKAPIVDDHLVNPGQPDAYVPTSFYLLPASSNDYFGLQGADRRFTEIAHFSARTPYYKKDLEDFHPIDFAHQTRYLNPHLGLVWLANDSLSKLQLELSAALFRFSFHQHLNSVWGYVQGTGLRRRIEETGLNPAQGGSFGRAVGWGLIGTVGHYATGNATQRAQLRPWLRTVANTARRSQSACTGNPTAKLIGKAFKGLYRSRQSFEVGYFVNSAEAMRSTVFADHDSVTAGVLEDLVVAAAYSTISAPFWNAQESGQERLVAVRPADPALPEFCQSIPANGFGNIGYYDHKTAMPAWSYAYRVTGDGIFLQRTMEALGGTGNALAEFEARGLEDIEAAAPLFALLQSL